MLGAGAALVAAALPAPPAIEVLWDPVASGAPPQIIHVLYETIIEHGEEFLPGWYFWDEVWVNRHGPFATRKQAIKAMDFYCMDIEQVHGF